MASVAMSSICDMYFLALIEPLLNVALHVVFAFSVARGEVVAHVEHLAYGGGFYAFTGNHVDAFFLAVLLMLL